MSTVLSLPQIVSIDPHVRPECETNFNVSECHRSGPFKLRVLKVPGRSHARSSKGLHEIQPLLPREWYEVQGRPHVGRADFATVTNMIDPTTGGPTVGLVSPFYERGGVLEQTNTTTEQKKNWSLQICEAVAHLHDNGIVHGNVHPRNILIQDDGSAVLTDACLYTLTVDHVITGLPLEIQTNLGFPKTVASKTTASVQHFGGKIPAAVATEYGDIFGLATSIWMIFEGKEPWSERQATLKVLKSAHRDLQRPTDMSLGLWRVLHALFSQESGSKPTLKEIEQELAMIQ